MASRPDTRCLSGCPVGAVPAGGGAQEVGNKAWNLMLMARAGLPVPAAFVLPTSWCRRPVPAHEPLPRATLSEGIARLETATGLAFGAARRPLLVSVRSGAAVSMPGMMETVLDVGVNAEMVEGLIRLTGNPRLAWDGYGHLVQGYAEAVRTCRRRRLTCWWPQRWFVARRRTSGSSIIAASAH
jgi:pyruvate,orthophosphate dikinase